MELSKERIEYSQRYGNNAESIFRKFIESRGHQVIDTSEYENKIDKKDFYVDISGKLFSFDVKTKHSDSIWLEIKNIHKYPGSLYGKQTHFAYYYHNLNILAIVKRTDMVEYVKENTIKEFYKASKGIHVPYHYLYNRKGRKDILVKTKREFLSLSVPSYREYTL
jgi:uncharacterized membrane protein (UPF0182 family)